MRIVEVAPITMMGLHVERWVAEEAGAERAVVHLTTLHDRRWAFVDVMQLSAAEAVRVMLAMRRWLADSRETVYALAQTDKHATAERLLGIMGFVPTDETGNGMRVWQWQKCRPSPV